MGFDYELSCLERIYKAVNSTHFDHVSGVLVMLNAAAIGIQTDHFARSPLEPIPAWHRVLELFFCGLFTVEVSLRYAANRGHYFEVADWRWNLFDIVLVAMQVIEEMIVFLARVFSHSIGENITTINGNFTVMRVLRLLRLARIVRLVRVMRLIGELRTLVMSILGSMKSLFWASVLLLLMIYIAAIFFCQVVADHRQRLLDDRESMDPALYKYFETLGLSIWSLFACVTGGVDWDRVARPLVDEISPAMAYAFALYISFTVLSMMNAITGVFTETALKSAKKDKEQYMVTHVRELFQALDINAKGMITWPELEPKLYQKEFQEYLKAIDIDVTEAEGLFKLLDLDDNGCISAEEFLDGCMRIRGPARALETMLLLRETNRVSQTQRALLKQIEGMCAPSAHGPL